MSRGSDDIETKQEVPPDNGENGAASLKSDIELIMETISTRGDIVEKLREVLTTKVTCSKQVQRDVLVEVILMKYNLSFEHTLHYLRRVRPILDDFLLNDGAA